MRAFSLKGLLPGLGLYLVLALTASIYHPGLDGTLILDDYSNLAPLQEFLTGKWSWQEAVESNESGPLGRPISMSTFVLNYATTGDSIEPLKATNLALHLISGALIFWLIGRLLLEIPSVRPWRWHLALWVAAVWLLSPVFVSTVLYVIQRMAQLATLFSLLGMLLYVIGRQRIRTRFRSGAATMASSLLICWPLATFSKENGAILPLLLFVTEFFWFHFQGERRVNRLLYAFFAFSLGLPVLAFVGVMVVRPDLLLKDYIERAYTPIEHLLTEARVLLDYVRVLVFPKGASMGVYHDDIPLSRGLFSPLTTFPAVALWIGAIALAVKYRKRELGLVLYGVMFFLAAQSVESTFLPLELYFEHRTYLPAIGIYLSALMVVLFVVRAAGPRLRIIIGCFLVAFACIFAGATYQRVLAWKSWGTILLTSAKSHPDSLRSHADLANYYGQRSDVRNALKEMDTVDRLMAPRLSGPLLHRLIIHCWTGMPLKEPFFSILHRVNRLTTDTYTLSALDMLADMSDAGECREQFKAMDLSGTLKRWYRNTDVVGSRSMQRNLHYFLARIFRDNGDMPAALAHLSDAMAVLPGHLEAGLLSLRYMLEAGDIGSARKLVVMLKRGDRHYLKYYSDLLDDYARVLAVHDVLNNANESATR